MKELVNVGVSNKHIHLSQEHVDILFGEGHQLTPIKDLSQPGQFACDEKVDVEGPKGTIKGIRILGPTRNETQIEVALGDTFKLGVKAPIRNSGDIAGSAGAKIIGPKGEVEINEGVIVAARHIHMSLQDGEDFGVKDKDIVSVVTEGERSLQFNNVLVRVGANYALDMHLDMEEANAAGLKNGNQVKIVK